jgi:uncharacterized protein YndB with AHSA1/START domain
MSDAIELTKEIAAPPAAVFRALTDPAELDRWWTTSSVSEARTGGRFEYHFEFERQPERDHSYTGAYHEVVPDEKVSYPWAGRLGETQVTVALRPAGGGTELALAHTGWGEGGEWPEAVELHRDGWGFFLENLKTYLERGEDRRPEALGLRTPAAVSG